MGDNTTPQPQTDGTAKTNAKSNNNPNNKTKQNNSQTQGQKPGSPNANNKGGKKYNNNNGAGNKNQRGGKKPKPSPEAQKKINEIRQATNNYYSEEDIFNVLQQQNFDQDRAFQILKDKRQNSWSAIVKKVQPLSTTLPAANSAPAPVQPSPVATPNTASNADQKAETEKKATPNSKTQAKKQKKAEKQSTAQQEPPAPEPEKVQQSADAKIADLEEQVAKDLSVIESKAQHLKNLREELRSVKAERDAQIQSLQTEKTTLLERREQLEKELTQIKERVVEIDKNVNTLQKEKDQKIKVLEEKYNKAIKDQ